MSMACEIATNKAKNWVALLTVGGCLLASLAILAMIGLGFGVYEVADFLILLNENGTLHFWLIAGVILVVLPLVQREYKKKLCK